MVELPVYLDSQASSRLPAEVKQAMLNYWDNEFGNPHSPHEHGGRALKHIRESLISIADLIGAFPKELTILSGATAANNLAVQGVENLIGEGRDTIVISNIEHPCVTETCQFMAKHRGFKLKILPVDKEGFLQIDVLKEALDERVALVSIMLGNNEIGTLQNIASLAKEVHRVGALIHTDATQAVGRIPIDILELDCDMLSFSAHKIGGPIGIGALFVRDGIQLLPLIKGGGQQDFLSGTQSPELIIGFGKACDLAGERLKTGRSRKENILIEQFETGLKESGYSIKRLGPSKNGFRLPGTISLKFDDIEMHKLQTWIAPFVSFSTRSACSTTKVEVSHVLKAIGLTDSEAENCARFSVDHASTGEQIEVAVGYFKKYLDNDRNS